MDKLWTLIEIWTQLESWPISKNTPIRNSHVDLWRNNAHSSTIDIYGLNLSNACHFIQKVPERRAPRLEHCVPHQNMIPFDELLCKFLCHHLLSSSSSLNNALKIYWLVRQKKTCTMNVINVYLCIGKELHGECLAENCAPMFDLERFEYELIWSSIFRDRSCMGQEGRSAQIERRL